MLSQDIFVGVRQLLKLPAERSTWEALADTEAMDKLSEATKSKLRKVMRDLESSGWFEKVFRRLEPQTKATIKQALDNLDLELSEERIA